MLFRSGASAITSYLVYAYTDAAGTTLASGPTNPQTDSTVAGCTTTASSCSHTFTGLSNGTTYWFRMAAVSGAGVGEVSTLSGSATPATVPDAPTMTDLNPGNTTVEVHWSTPTSNGGAAIDHFDVYAYTDAAGTVLASVSSPYANPQQVSGAATVKAIFRGLTNLTTYYFRVVAHNAEGDSVASTVSDGSTPLPVSDPPTGVIGEPGNQQITVSWTPPVHQGVSALTSYKVYVYADAETLVQVGSVHTVSGSPLPTSYTVTGLDNGTPYWFEVAAVNTQGSSMNSDESSSVTPRTVPDVPTVMESGVIPNYDVTTWYGFFAPKSTPRPIVDKLNKVLNEVLAEDTIKERLTKAGVVVKGSTPDEWRQFMIAEYKKWSSVREKAGIEQR